MQVVKGRSSFSRKLRCKIVSIGCGLIAVSEVIGFFITGSLAVLGDALHSAVDGLAAYVAFRAISIGGQEASVARATLAEAQGTRRNGFLLLIMAGMVEIAALTRAVFPHPVHGQHALIFIAVALFMALGLRKIYGDPQGGDHLMGSARVHVDLDILSSLVALLAVIMVAKTGNVGWDPAGSALMGLLFAWSGCQYILRAAEQIRWAHSTERGESDGRAS